MTSRSVLAALSLAVLLGCGACSVPDQKTPVDLSGPDLPTSPTTVVGSVSAPGTKVAVYFVASTNSLVAVARPDPTQDLGLAINDLLAGPSSEEVAAGVSSAIPSGTKLIDASATGGMAELNFAAPLTSATGHEELLAFAQIVATATSVPGVAQVQVSVQGKPVNAPRPDGTLAQKPVNRGDYASLLPK